MSSLRVHLERAHYPVLGSSLDQIRASIATLGPVRGGRRFGAFTDWEVAWRFEHEACNQGRRVGSATVSVRASMSLPVWHVPRNAPAHLVASWTRYIAVLEEHERGHVAIAERAGAKIRAALLALPPSASMEQLREAARRAAGFALDEARAEERRYDADTNHGEAQGARLPSSSIDASDKPKSLTIPP